MRTSEMLINRILKSELAQTLHAQTHSTHFMSLWHNNSLATAAADAFVVCLCVCTHITYSNTCFTQTHTQHDIISTPIYPRYHNDEIYVRIVFMAHVLYAFPRRSYQAQWQRAQRQRRQRRAQQRLPCVWWCAFVYYVTAEALFWIHHGERELPERTAQFSAFCGDCKFFRFASRKSPL